MTPKEFRSVAKYVIRTAAEYGLRDWQIVVHEGTKADDLAAGVWCVYGRRIAHVSVADDFTASSPEEQRRIVLHELTHIHLDQTTTLIQEALPGILGAPAYAVFEQAYRQAMEHATDAIADAVAERYEVWVP